MNDENRHRMTSFGTDSQPGRLSGFIAATHTPLFQDGSLNTGAVECQALHLLANGLNTVFIGGTTGECHSLSLEERLRLADAWLAFCRGGPLSVIVHVGSNSLPDARAMAAQAEAGGARAIAAVAPSYFRPSNMDGLVQWCAAVAEAAPATPFFYYDIPALTGIHMPNHQFLESAARRIPTLAGLKFSNPDMMDFQYCLAAEGGKFDIPWGIDEWILGAIAVGARSAVGSTYNFSAPVYRRLVDAVLSGDLDAARLEQLRAVRLAGTLASHGYMSSAKALMTMLGVDVGPPRLPHATLSPGDVGALRSELEVIGYFDWGVLSS